jgi:hypothetical protein
MLGEELTRPSRVASPQMSQLPIPAATTVKTRRRPDGLGVNRSRRIGLIWVALPRRSRQARLRSHPRSSSLRSHGPSSFASMPALSATNAMAPNRSADGEFSDPQRIAVDLTTEDTLTAGTGSRRIPSSSPLAALNICSSSLGSVRIAKWSRLGRPSTSSGLMIPRGLAHSRLERCVGGRAPLSHCRPYPRSLRLGRAAIITRSSASIPKYHAPVKAKRSSHIRPGSESTNFRTALDARMT